MMVLVGGNSTTKTQTYIISGNIASFDFRLHEYTHIEITKVQIETESSTCNEKIKTQLSFILAIHCVAIIYSCGLKQTPAIFMRKGREKITRFDSKVIPVSINSS